MRSIIWSATARHQYLSALDYLAERNESAAERLFERVEATAASLGRRPAGRPGYAEGTFERIVTKTPYVLVFELAGDELRILRLFHMSQDWRGWRSRDQ